MCIIVDIVYFIVVWVCIMVVIWLMAIGGVYVIIVLLLVV